jgi:hypothetical protein
MKYKFILSLMVAIVTIIISGNSNAALVSFTDSLTTDSGGKFDETRTHFIKTNVGDLTLSKFDSSLGTLNKVTLTLSNSFTWGPDVLNNVNPVSRNFVLSLDQNVSILEGTTELLTDLYSLSNKVWTVAANSSMTVPSVSTATKTLQYEITGSGLANYVGNDSLNLDVLASQYVVKTIFGKGNSFTAPSFITVGAQITYDYTLPASSAPLTGTAVPIPATLPLLCSGIAYLALLRRRMKN